MPKDPDGRPEEPTTREEAAGAPEPAEPEAGVDEASEESFPASDPPSHWSGTGQGA